MVRITVKRKPRAKKFVCLLDFHGFTREIILTERWHPVISVPTVSRFGTLEFEFIKKMEDGRYYYRGKLANY